MPRPTDWSPLADSDPLPGDPVQIGVEARYLETMAEQMRIQISRLHAIANDDELVGRYADKLRTASSDLAGNMGEALGRYQITSGELEPWGRELDTGQAETAQALPLIIHG